MRWCSVGALAGALVSSTAWALPPLESQGVVAPGVQFAAVADEDSIHVISTRYVRLSVDGTVLVDEGEASDGLQGPLDMYPAIATGQDGIVHVVTRSGGSGPAGTAVRYASRSAAGAWSAPVMLGEIVPRNYSVGVAAPAGRVLVGVSRLVEGSDARIDLYAVEGNAATLLGSTPQGWLRPDGDFMMAASPGGVALASGSPWPDGPVRVAVAGDAAGDVVAQWQASVVEHAGGGGRRGGPSLAIDGGGAFHLVYGAEQALFHARHDAPPGVETMNGLGTWHLSYGNGAVAVSPDGTRVAVVGLSNPDGDATSADALVWVAESVDGGATFGPAVDTGFVADGGEGRMRPRLLEVEGTLALLLRDDALGGIALATAPWFDDAPGGTTGGPEGTTGGGADGSTSLDPDPSGGTSSSTGQPPDAEASSTTVTSAGLDPSVTAGATAPEDSGCACRATPGRGSGGWALLLVGWLVVGRVSRRCSRARRACSQSRP
ncbi:MAG: hypothetical protein AAGA54_08205 [Myxococcota bacterium]